MVISQKMNPDHSLCSAVVLVWLGLCYLFHNRNKVLHRFHSCMLYSHLKKYSGTLQLQFCNVFWRKEN